jgi:hypothetical protein
VNTVTIETISLADRSDADRRDFDWQTVLFGFMRSRRRDVRRGSDGEPIYTDWHHPWLFFLAVSTMLLSSADAFFTLQLLSRGFIEINPVMNAAINQGIFFFAASKVAMTGFGVMVLVFLSRARFMNVFPTGAILTGFFSFYACLVCYEVVFLLRIM